MTTTLNYQGSRIRLRGTMLNLTDMWRAAGRPEDRRPADWLALEETTRFRAYADTHWTELDRGGNFLAMEQPAAYVADVRTFFTSLR